jgi:hypothetical protein
MTRVKPKLRGCEDREGHNLYLEGPSPKAFGGTGCDAHFLRRSQVSGNVVKCDDISNPSIWLEDYRLACRLGGANDDLFIIEFLPIYSAYSARA